MVVAHRVKEAAVADRRTCVHSTVIQAVAATAGHRMRCCGLLILNHHTEVVALGTKAGQPLAKGRGVSSNLTLGWPKICIDCFEPLLQMYVVSESEWVGWCCARLLLSWRCRYCNLFVIHSFAYCLLCCQLPLSENKEAVGAIIGGDSAGIGGTVQFRDLWQFFDEPFGHEVPLTLQRMPTMTYFVPYLSAIQLFSPPIPPTTPSVPSFASSSSRPSSPASPSASGSNVSPLVLPTSSSPVPVGPLSPNSPLGRGPPMFEYYERAGPNQRIPLADKIRELAVRCPFLLSGSNAEIDRNRSWLLSSPLPPPFIY